VLTWRVAAGRGAGGRRDQRMGRVRPLHRVALYALHAPCLAIRGFCSVTYNSLLTFVDSSADIVTRCSCCAAQAQWSVTIPGSWQSPTQLSKLRSSVEFRRIGIYVAFHYPHAHACPFASYCPPPHTVLHAVLALLHLRVR